MGMAAVEDLVGSDEGALDVVVLVDIYVHVLATH